MILREIVELTVGINNNDGGVVLMGADGRCRILKVFDRHGVWQQSPWMMSRSPSNDRVLSVRGLEEELRRSPHELKWINARRGG